MSALHAGDTCDPVNIWLWERSKPREHDEVADSSVIRRHLLACVYGGDISDWSVGWNDLGKPRVIGSSSSQPIRISATRTENIEAFACCRHGALGVDIESMSHSADRLHYVCHAFTQREQHILAQQVDKDIAIIDLWLLKESYGKAVGIGIDILQEEHYFDLRDRSRPRLYRKNSPSYDDTKWQFHITAPRSDLRLALAVKSVNHQKIPVRMQWIDTHNIFLPWKPHVRPETRLHPC